MITLHMWYQKLLPVHNLYLQVLFGLFWEGEGGGNCVPGIFLRVLYRTADVELKKNSLKLISYVRIRFWLVNISFNDIETSNDIDETGDLEATFTLDNMELGLAMPGRQCRYYPFREFKIRRRGCSPRGERWENGEPDFRIGPGEKIGMEIMLLGEDQPS